MKSFIRQTLLIPRENRNAYAALRISELIPHWRRNKTIKFSEASPKANYERED